MLTAIEPVAVEAGLGVGWTFGEESGMVDLLVASDGASAHLCVGFGAGTLCIVVNRIALLLRDE